MFNLSEIRILSAKAIAVSITFIVIFNLTQQTIGLKQKDFQARAARKLFGGYRITPKQCRATKTLPNSDPRATGPKICMFNHECAQRGGEVVGACMDGFLFGACCQVPPTYIIESTLLMDAQNSYHQQLPQQPLSNAAAAQSYELYGGSQQQTDDTNEFHEIKFSSTSKYQSENADKNSPTVYQEQSSAIQDLESDSQNQGNLFASQNNKIQETPPNFYVEKNSVSVSLPQHSNHQFLLIASSSPLTPIQHDDRMNYTTELPTKFSSTMTDFEASSEFDSFEEDHTATQFPIIFHEIGTLASNYSQQQQSSNGEFTHSDITHPGADSILLENEMTTDPGYGPEPVYVPSAAYDSAAQFQSNPGSNNNKYVLVQTITNDQVNRRPATNGATTVSSITTNIDSIESIILMLNSSNHGPSYNVQNVKHNPLFSSYGTEKPFYGSTNSISGTSLNHEISSMSHSKDPYSSKYSLVTTLKPSSISTGSNQVVGSNSINSHSTLRPSMLYQEIETKRPGNYHSNTPAYLERVTSDSVSPSSAEAKPSSNEHLQNSYPSPPSSQVFGDEKITYDHTDPIANYNDQSSSTKLKPNAEFNKMPGVGIAYPVDMSYLDEDETNLLENNEDQQDQQVSGINHNGYAGAHNKNKKAPSNNNNQASASLPGSHIITTQTINQAVSQGTLVSLPQEVILQAQQPSVVNHIQHQEKTSTTKPARIASSTSFRPPLSTRPFISTSPQPLSNKPSNIKNKTASTLQPVAIISSSSIRPPSKRPTKIPSITSGAVTNRNPPLNNIKTSHKPLIVSSTSQSLSTMPEEIIIAPTRAPPAKHTNAPTIKKRPSTSYVTGPTSPRPQIIFDHSKPLGSSATLEDEKNDSYFSSTTAKPSVHSSTFSVPVFDYSVEPLQVQHVEHSPQNHYNKPTFVKIPPVSPKPASPTVIITPKPTTLHTVSSTTWTQAPSTFSSSFPQKQPTSTASPAFGSTSYIFSPMVTRRPEYQIDTHDYVSLPTVTSNDFDDPGYYGAQSTHRPSVYTPSSADNSFSIPTDDRPSFPGYYGPTPSYPSFPVPGAFDDKLEPIAVIEETYTSPNDFVNFPPVRNPNFNLSATGSSVTTDLELSTPAFVEDVVLKNKMNTLVNKIVESLQDNFEALADMIDDNNTDTTAGSSLVTKKPATTRKPTIRPVNTSTLRPKVTTRKPVVRISTQASSLPTTKRPTLPTRKPAATRKPTTKKPVTRKPTRKVATTTTAATLIGDDGAIDEGENEIEEEEAGGETGFEGRKIQCGVRPHVRSGKIVGGRGSTFAAYPWQVLVRESTWLGLFTKNKCGGVLITNRYVTTAAHCQPGFLASLVAVLGEFDITGDLEAKRSVTKNVKRVIVHRLYDAASFENDIALLELESPVHYDTHIVPICMPPDAADFTGRMATVTGWGRLKYGGGIPSVLQEVQVPIIENSVCQEMFHTAGHNKKILPSFLCAGYANGQKDSCEGDSGGPLVLQRPDGRYELAGTVSHGIKCAAPYLPGVYMRTTFYKPWLKSVTGVK